MSLRRQSACRLLKEKSAAAEAALKQEAAAEEERARVRASVRGALSRKVTDLPAVFCVVGMQEVIPSTNNPQKFLAYVILCSSLIAQVSPRDTPC